MARKVGCLAALLAICLVGLGEVAWAAGGQEAKPIRTVQLRVKPAPEPRYALQYLLETPYREQRPQNGALLYQTAISQLMEINSGEHAIDRDTLREWDSSPLEILPTQTVRKAIGRFERVFRYVDAAARCERCTWEYPVREDALRYVMPQLGEYRTLCRLLGLKARLAAGEGDFEGALGTLRSGFSMGRDLGGGACFVQHLVGIAIAAEMVSETAALIQEAEAPNLYWALTALRRPLVDARGATQMEATSIYDLLPELETAEEAVLTNEQVLDLWTRATALLEEPQDPPGRWLDHARDITSVMARYPRAKAHLREQGYADETVEGWPVLYAVLVYQHQQFRALRDASFKWSYVPYAQAREGLREAELEVGRIWKYSSGSILANPFVSVMPALYRIHFLNARLERDIAMLRCVEAIRMYAAEHEGTLPGALAEIKQVPIPSDPVHGRAFDYRIRGGKAILESRVPPDGHRRDGLRYEITLR